jgi:hypothetical protein
VLNSKTIVSQNMVAEHEGSFHGPPLPALPNMIETPLRRLQFLLESVFESPGSEIERREFAALVERHPELTSRLLEQLEIHSLLQWQCDQMDSRNLHLPPLPDSRGEVRESPRRITRVIKNFMVSIAVVLLMATGAVGLQACGWPSFEFVATTRCAF